MPGPDPNAWWRRAAGAAPVLRLWLIGPLVAAAATACGGDTPMQTEDDDDDPPVVSFDFLRGSWEVVSRYQAEGATTRVESAAAARVTSDLGGRALELAWWGTRDGADVETLSLVVRNEAGSGWIVARADAGAGTFDVLDGTFVQSRIVLSSRADTRPDGGRSRETFEAITDSSFTWSAERSADGGATWTEYWTMAFRRVSASTPPAEPIEAVGCAADEYRQFDFWAGDWQVGGASNLLRPLVGGCVLEENWTSSTETGTSFNMYDHRTGLWNQVWTDTNLFTLVIMGGLDGDRMVMEGPRFNNRVRISWTPLANGHVRQHGETSADGGSTWSTDYDLDYAPR